MGCGSSKSSAAVENTAPQNQTATTVQQNQQQNASLAQTNSPPPLAPSPTPAYRPPSEFPSPQVLVQSQLEYAEFVENGQQQTGTGDSGKPLPLPPTEPRSDWFDREQYRDIREHIFYEPPETALSSMQEVSDRLCTLGQDDIGKLYAMFSWLVHSTKHMYEFELTELPSRDSVLYDLLLAHAGYVTYNSIFESLCSCAGFDTKSIQGVVKSVYESNHIVTENGIWLAVLVNNKWFLVDVNSAISVCNRQDLVLPDVTSSQSSTPREKADPYEASDFYFLADPTNFVFTHFTDDEQWQLLAKPVSHEEFKTMAHLTEFYFIMNFADVDQARGVLITDNGQVSINLTCGTDLKLSFSLVKLAGTQVHHTINGLDIERLVTVSSEGQQKTINMDFIHIGRYGFKVWASEAKRDAKIKRLIGHWFIQVNKPVFDYQIIPETPLMEYGPSAEMANAGLTTDVQEITEGLVHISFTSEKKMYEFFHKLESKDIPKAKLKQHYRYYVANTTAGIVVKFPRPSTYVLHTLIQEFGSRKDFHHVCSFLHKTKVAYNDPTPFPPAPHPRIGYIPTGERAKLIPVSHPVPFFQIEDAPKEALLISMQSKLYYDFMTHMDVRTLTSSTPDDVTNYTWLYTENGDGVYKYNFEIRLPRGGLYSLTMFSRGKGDTGVYRELYRYLFTVNVPQKCLPFPGRHAGWSPVFWLDSPSEGYLKEHTSESLTLEVPTATEVVVFHGASPKYQNLEFNNKGRFSGQIQTLAGNSSLTVAARFPQERNILNLLQYEVLTDADWNEMLERQEEAAQEAQERLDILQDNLVAEHADAETRQKQLDNDIEQREIEWMQHRDEYFAEEERLQEEFEEQFKARENEREEKEQEVLTNEDKDEIVVKEMKLILEEQDKEIMLRRRMYRELAENLYRQRLIQAIKLKDKAQLETTIRESKANGLTQKNSKELRTAERLVDIINVKKELVQATKERDVNVILLILDDVMAKGYHAELQYEVSDAERVVGAINRNERLNAFILAMEKTTMSELRSYQKPPTEVHKVMQAVFLLLGEDEHTTSEWSNCAALSNPYGKNGLNRRVQKLDIENVHPEIRERAKQILSEIDFKHIRHVSTGAAAFYVWALGLIEDYEKTEGSQTARSTRSGESAKPANTSRQREIFGRSSLEPSIPEYEYGRYERRQRDSFDSSRTRGSKI